MEREHMASISYASVVDSLMYAKVSTRLDITFAVEVPGRYQNNLGTEHCKDARKVLRYLQGNKNYWLAYKHSDNLYTNSDSDFAGCVDTRKSTFLLVGGAVSWKSSE